MAKNNQKKAAQGETPAAEVETANNAAPATEADGANNTEGDDPETDDPVDQGDLLANDDPEAGEPVTGEEDTTTMVFGNPVTLTINHGEVYKFPKGIQEVPSRLADHWYLAAHGVRKYRK